MDVHIRSHGRITIAGCVPKKDLPGTQEKIRSLIWVPCAQSTWNKPCHCGLVGKSNRSSTNIHKAWVNPHFPGQKNCHFFRISPFLETATCHYQFLDSLCLRVQSSCCSAKSHSNHSSTAKSCQITFTSTEPPKNPSTSTIKTLKTHLTSISHPIPETSTQKRCRKSHGFPPHVAQTLADWPGGGALHGGPPRTGRGSAVAPLFATRPVESWWMLSKRVIKPTI